MQLRQARDAVAGSDHFRPPLRFCGQVNLKGNVAASPTGIVLLCVRDSRQPTYLFVLNFLDVKQLLDPADVRLHFQC